MHVDHKYITFLRNNDPKGIREIYDRFSNEAIRWVQNNNGTIDDARDIFQEAVLALYDKARNPDFVLTCPLGALLYVFYSRKWIDQLRAKKKEGEVRIQEELRYKDEVGISVLELAETVEQESQKQKSLSVAFKQLSELCQQLLQLVGEGIIPAKIADTLQMNSVDTLYRRKNACIARWKELYLALPN